jgi:hypothetical protein
MAMNTNIGVLEHLIVLKQLEQLQNRIQALEHTTLERDNMIKSLEEHLPKCKPRISTRMSKATQPDTQPDKDICACGSRAKHINQHLKTKKHQKWLLQLHEIKIKTEYHEETAFIDEKDLIYVAHILNEMHDTKNG